MRSSLTIWLAAALLLVNGTLWAADSSGTDKVLAEIEYFYADDGTLTGKAINGQRMNFEYDLRGQLLAVKDAQGKDLERYTYDPAGNRLSKTISGITTTYTYDKANQLVSSTVEDFTTYYKYDSAGRMIQAGDKTYRYNGQNKVVEVKENGKVTARFDYYMDGQLAQADYADRQETFLWDGLSLIQRNDVKYINEPYITGGNPIMANNDVMLNDMLGSTAAINNKVVEMTSFGETDAVQALYTGKPQVDELGYTFLFRNYNPNQGKWTTADPLCYPDGWNNLAYCNNGVTISVDWFGAASITINAACAGTGSSSGGGSSGGMGSTSGGWGHSWFDLTDSNGQTTGHGFYPSDPAGFESVLGHEYGKAFSGNDTADYDNQNTPYASLTIDITDEQLKKIQDYIDNYDKNWSLYNNCTDYVMDALRAAGIDISSYDYTTAGVADPDKLHQTILDKGGRIKE
ncbi:MAG: hypothetical protein E7052_00845 [Lentisphaerae bacterium]|nr:hypothetical protein [Lentisphaerota bacterium]